MSTATELRLLTGQKWVRRGVDAINGVDASYDVIAGGSIQAAIDGTPEGGTVRIGPGKYRLTSRLQPKRAQKLLGPSSGGAAIITGDVLLNGWVKDGSANRWYTTSGGLPGPYDDNGQCEVITGPNANACKKREQVWIDGVHLERVMTVDQVTPTRFYQDYDTRRTYIGQDPATLTAAGKVVEMSKLADAINSNAVGLVLQRLQFQRFASAGQAGAVILSGTDIEVAYCRFTENHAIGFHMTTAHRARIHHNTFIRNGQLGMGHHRSHNTIIEDNEFIENNTDGFWRADWESGGFKATYSDGTVCRRNTAHNNEGIGIWFDIDNINIDCYDNVCTDNYADGIRYEISFAAKLHDNRISGNGYRYATAGGRGQDVSMFAVAGINVNSSPDVEVYNNEVLNNQNGISLQSRSRGSSTTWPNEVRETRNAWVHHNRVRQSTGSAFGEGVAAGLNTLGQGTNSGRFYSGLNNRFDHNTYEVVSLTDRRFAWNQGYVTFANFQEAGQDRNSTVSVIPRPGFRIKSPVDDGAFTIESAPQLSTAGNYVVVGDWDAENYSRTIFLRFRDVNIPRGSNLQSAKLEVKSFGIDTAIPRLQISGHAAGDSPEASTRVEMAARPRTTATVPWAPSEWINNAWTDAPSVTPIIQEIVNRPDWRPGNSITLFIQPETIGWTGRQARISIRAYEQSPADAAGLIVNWT